MIAYLDSSVLLRILLNQPHPLAEFSKLRRAVASKLLKAECLRSLDRSRVLGFLTGDEYVTASAEIYEALDSVEFIELTDAILARAGASFPVALGTLDAIHLASAITWQEETDIKLTFLTHDDLLAKAARAMGFSVLGAE